MFGKRIRLFKLLGFEVSLNISWFILAILITWTLAKGFFPHYFKDLTESNYWWMGVAGTLGLFISIILHELSHSVVARQYGIPMKGITLFIFGGVAEMDKEPPSPKVELLMAIAGPLASILITLICYQIYILGKQYNWPVSVNGVFAYLAFINGVLAIFNLLPAFPLDGGRVFRSALWYWKKNYKWATRVSSQTGSTFGVGLIILGVLYVITGNFISGVWFVLIGFFLRSAAQMSYKQLFIREALGGEHVKRFMKTEPITVSPTTSIQQLVEDYFYKYHFKMFPVIDDSRLIGYVTTSLIKEIPKESWKQSKVGDIVTKCTNENSIGPDADAMDALATMYKSGNSRLMVVDDDKLVGIVSLKDMMEFLSVKVDLERN